MIQIAICDDRPEDAQALERLISAGNDCPIAAYSSGEGLLWDLENDPYRFDLFFLDIYLTGISGIETARRIRAINQTALIVFVSTSEDFYREAYDLFAFNYLIKPVTVEKLSPILDRATKRLETEDARRIHFTHRSQTYSVRCSQILYLASSGHLVTLYLQDGRALDCYGKLGALAEQLPQDIFLRCHQSYLVNLNYITALDREGFRVNDALVPISKSYSKTARARYREHLFSNFD